MRVERRKKWKERGKRGRAVKGVEKTGIGEGGLDLLGEAGSVGLGGGYGGAHDESVNCLHFDVPNLQTERLAWNG